MSQSAPALIQPGKIWKMLVTYRWRWAIPVVVFTALAAVYAFTRTSKWQARQAMVIRDEAIGNLSRPGKFDSIDAMKTAQETLQQLAKSRSVVRAALVEVGPPDGRNRQVWPSDDDVKSLKQAIEIAAPQGAEFGHTEVIYLKLSAENPNRSIALTRAICAELDARIREIRDGEAQSLIDELMHTVALARDDLAGATAALSEIERQVGSDLTELRILNESSNGESNLTRTLIEIKNELRQAQQASDLNLQLKRLLLAAQADPSRLVATPSRLLESQPALSQMKDGLVAAQLRAAELLGSMSPEHPQVRAAQAAAEQIRRDLHQELELAVAGIEADLAVSETRVEALQSQIVDTETRLASLAKMRAGYANRVEDVRHRTEVLNRAEQELSEAQARQAAASSTSLLTLLDEPAGTDSPVGPGRASIVLVGLLGGLLTGLAVVFLTAPAAQTCTPESSLVPDQDLGHGLSLTKALKRLAAADPVWN